MVLQHLLPGPDAGVRAKVRGDALELLPALGREGAAESLHAPLWILKHIFRGNELVLTQVPDCPSLRAKLGTLLGLSEGRALVEARIAEFREVLRSDEVMKELVVVHSTGVGEMEKAPVVVARVGKSRECNENAVAQLAVALRDASSLQHVTPRK